METYLGTICAFGFNFAPYGWAFCQGQILPISQYAALFSLLGTSYGGNGTSTFGLPNLQSNVAIHMGQLTGGSNYSIGETGGASSVTLNSSNLPPHIHTVVFTLNSNNTTKSTSNPSGAFPGLEGTVKPYNAAFTPSVTMKPPTITLGNSGGGSPVSIIDPSLVMNYCIAMQGIFPTRG